MTRSAVLLIAGFALQCSSEDSTEGVTEPVRVVGGQFHAGELPGLPPLTPEEIADGIEPASPRVVSAERASGVLHLGDPSRTISGTASEDAAAVAFRIDGLGTGYWVEPVRDFNPDTRLFSWSFNVEFSRAIPAGLHTLLFAAVDERGYSGTQLDTSGLCVSRELPDNGNACAPAIRPPGLVVSLAWDQAVDLDLQVRTPQGALVDAKRPSTTDGSARLERDSNGNCVIDGTNRENLVLDAPVSGTYLAYANLFDACGKDSARFALTLNVPADGAEEGTFTQVESFRTSGVLLASQANGGSNIGLFVTSFVVP